MGKTTAPLLSFDAEGQIAKTLVYASWKGRSYARRYVIPANPNSAEQQLTRNTFRWLTALFKYYPGASLDAWQAYADSNRITDRNAFIKLNNGPLRTETTITDIILSPAARSGLIASAINITPAAGQLSVALTAPSLPTGWTITDSFAMAVRQQDPQTEAFYEVGFASDNSDPYEPVITGLDSATYVVGGWFEFTRPDGTLAYGQSLQDTAVVP